MDYATWPLQIKGKVLMRVIPIGHNLEKRNHQLLIQLNQRKRSEKAERSQCEKAKKVTRRPEEGEREKGWQATRRDAAPPRYASGSASGFVFVSIGSATPTVSTCGVPGLVWPLP
ncbi:hypothetical protein L1987_88497 [Smallanthus sonchifolius]|nr:hypothetical protein L1987_88497 [Smallanthus sonchifolius]